MVVYHGGKTRTGREIAEYIHMISTILEDQGCFTIRGYVEPFAGALGVFRYIPELFKNHTKLTYKAGDINESMIDMWKSIQKGWSPPRNCTEQEYNRLKKQTKPSALKGFIGHACAFGGQYFNSYRYNFTGGTNRQKNKHISSQADSVIEIGEQVQQVKFTVGDYTQFSNLKGYIIYCDPPYEGTTSHYYDEEHVLRKFDSSKFWKWCRKMAKNNLVFVSSYDAPEDFQLVWTAKTKARIMGIQDKFAVGTERLYMAVHL